jgi:hypothetical protein
LHNLLAVALDTDSSVAVVVAKVMLAAPHLLLAGLAVVKVRLRGPHLLLAGLARLDRGVAELRLLAGLARPERGVAKGGRPRLSVGPHRLLAGLARPERGVAKVRLSVGAHLLLAGLVRISAGLARRHLAFLGLPLFSSQPMRGGGENLGDIAAAGRWLRS